MTTTSMAQRLVAAAVLTSAMLLLGLVPAASAQQSAELDGWIYGRGAAQHDSTGSSQGFSDDGWARGQGMRAEQRTPVDGWAVGGGLRDQHPSTVHSSSGVRAVTPSPPAPAQVPSQLILVGFVLAVLLGGAVVIAANHRRHLPSAH